MLDAQLPNDYWRREHDALGERRVPNRARYGAHADRALENFHQPRPLAVGEIPEFARAFGMVKLAALQANVACGAIRGPVVAALERASRELIEDRAALRAGLVVPLLQGGAGTSTNMNVNEVLANRALELLGRPHGDYATCHPIDHVNRSQSTNDTYPTALRLALIERADPLCRAIDELVAELRRKGAEHADVIKLGRTQLQDAVPLSVADEFDAWADALESAGLAIEAATKGLHEINLGGTAIGTGLATPPGYAEIVVDRLAAISGRPLVAARRRVSATTDSGGLLSLSAAFRGLAIAMGKLANDLRLLGSGPETGFAELRLPPVQTGSSMMPGKVNPVIPEHINQVAFRVRGADATVALALDAAQLQLHAMLPVVAQELFAAQEDLTAALDVLRQRCIADLQVDAARAHEASLRGLGELSELAASRGHAAATRLAVAAGRSSLPQ